MTIQLLILTGLACSSTTAYAESLRLLRVVSLEYPQAALVQNIEGDVELTVYPDQRGDIDWVQPSGTESILLDAAFRNIHLWRFAPGSIDGKASVTIKYHFRIRDQFSDDDSPGFRFSVSGEVQVLARRTHPKTEDKKPPASAGR